MAKFFTMSISSSPHIRSNESTQTIMRDVLIALVPALIGACWFFGFRALTLSLVSIAACVFFEWLYRKVMKKDSTVYDLSAAVTGLLLAMVCPVGIPYWTLIIGDFIAIVLVKQLYGGIGKNFLNPALTARAFMFSWAALMTTWAPVGSRMPIFESTQKALDAASAATPAGSLDAISAATPLASLHTGVLPTDFTIFDAFLGSIGGSLGETSALLLLIGGLYLVVRKVISVRIPLVFIGTVAVLTFLFPQGNDRLVWMAWNLFSGGLFLGAIFMATDYCTSPVTKAGQVIFAIGCGALTVFIRYFGSYAEGVSYAILVMNACVGLLDKVGMPKRFGVIHKKGGKQA